MIAPRRKNGGDCRICRKETVCFGDDVWFSVTLFETSNSPDQSLISVHNSEALLLLPACTCVRTDGDPTLLLNQP